MHEHYKYKIFWVLWKMTFKTNVSLAYRYVCINTTSSHRVQQWNCVSTRPWCHFSNFLERGSTINCSQLHDIKCGIIALIFGRKWKILFSSWHLAKSLPEGGVPLGSWTVNLCNWKCEKKVLYLNIKEQVDLKVCEKYFVH